jgi:predicted nucleic-acid-binding Zn-ribbon protein
MQLMTKQEKIDIKTLRRIFNMRENKPAQRKCLRCNSQFMSEYYGNRLCFKCRTSRAEMKEV